MSNKPLSPGRRVAIDWWGDDTTYPHEQDFEALVKVIDAALRKSFDDGFEHGIAQAPFVQSAGV